MTELADDYGALRHGLAAYRRPRDVLSVAGPDAAAYLQGQCSQDLAGLAVGAVVDALLLEPDGKLTALVRVGRVADDGFVVDTDAGFGDLVAARLARFKLRSKLDLVPLAWPCVALRGPDVPAGLPGPADGLAAPVDWNGVTGMDLLGPGADDLVPAAARWVGDDAWEAVRVEAGLPAMGRELDDRTIAAEAELVDRTVSFTKGCYTGQELVARLDARGNKVARRLCGLVMAGAPPGTDPAALVGATLVVPGGDKPVGTVTSAAWCPGLGALGALGYVHRSVEVPGSVQVQVAGGIAAEARPRPLV